MSYLKWLHDERPWLFTALVYTAAVDVGIALGNGIVFLLEEVLI